MDDGKYSWQNGHEVEPFWKLVVWKNRRTMSIDQKYELWFTLCGSTLSA
jgi:hypothetical protein